jgi:hypothetical protein
MIPNDSPTNILVNNILDGYEELLQKSFIFAAFLDSAQIPDWRQRLQTEMQAGSGKREAAAQFAPLRQAAQEVLLGQAETLLAFPKPPTIQ